MYLVYCMETRGHKFHMFVLKMYAQIMSLSVLLCNVCICYVYILKMSKKLKVKTNQYDQSQIRNKGNGCGA